MQTRKISPLDFLAFLVVIVIFVLVSITCEQKFNLQKINGEKEMNINYYQDQTKILQTQIIDLQKKNELITTEKNNITQKIEKITQENQKINQKIQATNTENQKITTENQELSNNLVKLVEKQNSLMETASIASQLGLSKPTKFGFTPIFQLKLDSVEKTTQEDFSELSRGSYQRKKQIVNFSIEDIDSWKDLGNWDFTGYTATVEECDSTPSITANNTLVTPGFTLAVDPKYRKYGTIFYIDGFGFAIAADSGSAIKGKNRGDILVSDKTFSAHLTGQRNVWLVYSPPSSSSKKP